jgi:surface protein
MFNGAVAFNRNISRWNVGNVDNMSGMFHDATSFNVDINDWYVDNVTDMSNMFHGATSFNGEIGWWDVSNATNMSHMFYGASAFNRDISRWDVSNATDMSHMFYGASSFNCDISRWDLGSLTYGVLYMSSWVNISLTDEIRNIVAKQVNCPVTLTPITGIALHCLVCKYMFNKEVKKWIDQHRICPHCRSRWGNRIYYNCS